MDSFDKIKNKANEAFEDNLAPPVAGDLDNLEEEGLGDYSVVNGHWCERCLYNQQINHFGRLHPDDLDGFWYFYFELEEAEKQNRLPAKFAEFGITGGKEEWGAIWAAFYYRHFAHLERQRAQEKFLETMMNARVRHLVERDDRSS